MIWRTPIYYFFNEITNEVQWDDPGGALLCALWLPYSQSLQSFTSPHCPVLQLQACMTPLQFCEQSAASVTPACACLPCQARIKRKESRLL